MNKKFYLGVGAQKAGTTWLHEYLSSFKNFNLGFAKEYHIWDALFLGDCRSFLVPSLEPGVSAEPREVSLRREMQRQGSFYENYFSSLLFGNVDSTGDITPSYSGLSVADFELIRGRLEVAGFEVRVIFFMRDPFERCWSAVRMAKRNGVEQDSDEVVLSRSYRSHQYRFRTDYEVTIKKLENVFTRSQIYYGIYEEMMSIASLGELSKFCSVAPNYQFRKLVFNKSLKTEVISRDLRREVIKFYKDIYEFCYARFPQTRLLWHGTE